MANSELKKYEEKMDRRIDSLKESLSAIRAGRANPAVLDKIVVGITGRLPRSINWQAYPFRRQGPSLFSPGKRLF